MNKIIRSICYFSKHPTAVETTLKLKAIEQKLGAAGYEVQTKRLCAPVSIKEIDSLDVNGTLLSVGTLDKQQIQSQFEHFLQAKNVSFNVELCGPDKIDDYYIDLLFEIIKRNAAKTFNFTYVFRNRPSSPFFPSAAYHQDGFSIGLQSTDLAYDCETVDEWLNKMRACWEEINKMFKTDPEFLGIDSSVAPLFSGNSSFIHFVNQLFPMGFPFTVTTDFYVKITKFLKTQNPKPIGLCGIMFPCVEDFALAEAYEENDFLIERNIFLSLHSGLGIDTYPIGITEEKERVVEVLSLLKGLAEKYDKPLAARFVSDGKTKAGHKTDFKNPYLKDVVINPL
ncbi:MAG: DUF711 family protein [Candidatus Babeliales bacterium]